jgi:MATE family multidrug resistance protein
MLSFAGLFLVFNKSLALMFSDNTEVVLLGSQLLIIAAVFQLGDGIQAVCVGLLRGIEDVKVPSIITLIAYWGIAIPSAYFLGFDQNLGVRGIWFGLSLGLSASAVLLCIRFYKLLKRKQE